jgi:NAD(P)-dependent dehydrogenase (short-subunit alcohol dehydrogenase family)
MNPWYFLEGKTIWVVGGAGYFGSAITEELDGLCKKVICTDLEGRAAELVRQKKLSRTVADSLDISNVNALPAALDQILAKHGVPDGVVYLVTASSRGKSLEELSVEDFQKSFDLALPPTFLLCRTVAEAMKARGSGSFVVYSSMYGMVSPDPRIYHRPMRANPIDYGAGKAAILQMVRYFAVHYGPAGIRFNAITPGPFPHPGTQRDEPEFIARLNQKNPLGRIGNNHEVVGPTLFLLTDSASYVTGHNLVVDGGWTAW